MKDAISDFEKKFRAKTANSWKSRDNFEKVNGKYQLVEVEDEDDDGDGAALGKLSEAQIKKGQAVLEEIEHALDSRARADFASLSGKFYSFIPTTSGRVAPPVINNQQLHAEKVRHARPNTPPSHCLSTLCHHHRGTVACQNTALRERRSHPQTSLLEFWLRMGFEDMEQDGET